MNVQRLYKINLTQSSKMNKTKYTGVFERTTVDGIKTYYIKYSLRGKQYQEKVGTSIEGITAIYAADEFILDLAKDQDTCVISNDRYVEYFDKLAIKEKCIELWNV